MQIAKNTQRGLLIDKQKAAEVCVELLDAGARRNEIVIGPQVVELHLCEGFLQADMMVETIRSAAHVRSDDPEFAHFQVIQAQLGRDANSPIYRLEGRVPVE